MQAVVLAVVTGVIGVVTGAVPALLVSGRRRRADAVEEAADLLEKVKGSSAEDPVRAALEVNAADYLAWVDEGPTARASRQRWAGILACVIVAFALGVTQFLPDAGEESTRVVLLAVFCVPVTITGLLSLRWAVLSVTERKRPKSRSSPPEDATRPNPSHRA